MALITQSYVFKLPQKILLRQSVDDLKKVSMDAGQQLLEQLWTDEWIEALQDKKKKAFQVIYHFNNPGSISVVIHYINLYNRRWKNGNYRISSF